MLIHRNFIVLFAGIHPSDNLEIGASNCNDFFEMDSNVVTCTFVQQLKPTSLFVPIGLCMVNLSSYHVGTVNKISTLNNYCFIIAVISQL